MRYIVSAPAVSVHARRPAGDQPLGPQEASGAAQKSVMQAPHKCWGTGPAKAAQM